MILSVIFPVRVSNNRQYVLDNIARILSIKPNHPDVEFILVDSGSTSFFSERIKRLCSKYQTRYIYQDTRSQTFSIGRARDLGAQVANGQCIMFLDVDLIFDNLFFDKIIAEIKVRDMFVNIAEYFCIPCFYIDEEYSSEFLSLEDITNPTYYRKLQNDYECGNNTGIQSFAPATSLFVINRWHFLSIGGHRNEFSGHGSEDFELAHRLATYARKHHRTYNYYTDKKDYSSIEYEGFRSYFSMAGYSVYNNGLFAVHLWHPRPKDKYQVATPKNKEMLQTFMRDFDSGKSKIDPLDDLSRSDVTLVFGVRKDTAWLSIRQLLPLLGKVEYLSELKVDINKIGDLIRSRNITRFLFWNPYGNETRLAIYRWAILNNFPFYVFERGALPDSWFIDKGFNADSPSYAQEKWDRFLSNAEIIDTEEYINSVIQSGNTLEKNDNYRGEALIREIFDVKYRVGGRKILFIGLQRPSDSVIKFFSGAIQSYDNFITAVNDVIASLDPQEWYIVIKKHPLEPEFPKGLSVSNNVLLVDNEYHIHDLLSIAHKVMLINSGVGLLAMLFRKHVVHMGEAFYSFPSINSYAKSSKEALKLLESEFIVSEPDVIKFIHYLKNDFYSFANASYSRRTEKDGSFRSILESLEFYQIRTPDGIVLDVKYREHAIPLHSKVYGFFLPSIIREMKKNPSVFRLPIDVLNHQNVAKSSSGNKPLVDQVSKLASNTESNKSQKLGQVEFLVQAQPLDQPTLPAVDKKVGVRQMEALAEVERLVRLKNKFKRDPYAFFADSKNPAFSKLKFLYKKSKK